MSDQAPSRPAAAAPAPLLTRTAEAVPPHAWFGVSAVFHYLGPSFAVLLFPAVGVLGVAWFRIASAALVFAPITRPWRTFARADGRERILLLALGATLAVMNSAFYLALDRLPIALVAAIEFVGTIGVALWGAALGAQLARAGARRPRRGAADRRTLAPRPHEGRGMVLRSRRPRLGGAQRRDCSCSTSCWGTASRRAAPRTASNGWAPR